MLFFRQQKQQRSSLLGRTATTILVSLTILLSAAETTYASNTSPLDKPFSKSYAKLQHAACVTLYHRDGRSGCGSTERAGEKGKLLYFDGSLSNDNNAEEPFVAVMEDYDLTAQNVNTLIASYDARLNGILVLNSTSQDSGSGASGENAYHSPDAQTPQGYGTPSEGLQYGYYSYAWNAKGENLFALDLFGIPIAYVKDSDISDSLRQESKSDQMDDAIVAEFNYYMGQEGIDSLQCLAWKDVGSNEWSPKCLPLGGTSVWATAGSPPNPNGNNNGNNNKANKRPVVMLTTGMDSTSFFHDIAPGANTAASNILTLLMAARLLGQYIDDDTFDSLPKRILIGFFQGETYGFVGSRNFLRDTAYPGFQCNASPVPSVTRLANNANKDENGNTNIDYACLNPIRPSLAFAQLGNIAGMISVDQVAHSISDGILYVHYDKNNDSYGKFLAQVMMNAGTNSVSVSASSVANNGNGYSYPPTPLTSLLSLSEGAVGGAVLTGYDYAFTNKVPYHSHVDSAAYSSIHMKSIVGAATILARSALAAAYDDGSYDYATASAYAANLIPELSQYDETLNALADCVFWTGGQCDIFKKYAAVELANDRSRTGLNLQAGTTFPTPPSYYVGVYNGIYGQPFVQVGDNIYGAYKGNDYGKKRTDAVGLMPTQLESSIHGLLNHFLGQGKLKNGYNGRGGGNDDDGVSDPVKCSKASDCSNVESCGNYGEHATCTGGGMCVCTRAHYHVALDEALIPSPNQPTGYFEVSGNDAGVSPIYTEPYWSSDVGVTIFRDVGWLPGIFTLVAGVGAAFLSLFSAFVLRVGLKKEKLY